MEFPVWIKPALTGAVCGAAALAIVGFSWGGWVTNVTAQKSADAQTSTAIAAALTPYCVERSKTDPASVQILTDLKAASMYSRTDVITKAGWATPLGATEPSSALANACQLALTKA